MSFICTNFDEFEAHFGDKAATYVLERICEAGWSGDHSDPSLTFSVEQHDPCNQTLTGLIEYEGLEFDFKVDSGNWNGTVVREFLSSRFPEECQQLLQDAPSERMADVFSAVREDLLQHQFACPARVATDSVWAHGATLRLECGVEDGLAPGAGDPLFLRMELRMSINAKLTAWCTLQLYREVDQLGIEAVAAVRAVRSVKLESWQQAKAGLHDFVEGLSRSREELAGQIRSQLVEVLAP